MDLSNPAPVLLFAATLAPALAVLVLRPPIAEWRRFDSRWRAVAYIGLLTIAASWMGLVVSLVSAEPGEGPDPWTRSLALAGLYALGGWVASSVAVPLAHLGREKRLRVLRILAPTLGLGLFLGIVQDAGPALPTGFGWAEAAIGGVIGLVVGIFQESGNRLLPAFAERDPVERLLDEEEERERLGRP